ncbi:MAG: hypothetical protein GWO24_14685, partial [Akkermansiaceae bacterium]|nr:hypothetical protein [Akkermansiaceae bacterium]
KRKADGLGEELKKLEERKKAQKKTLDKARVTLARAIRNRWPALENKHSPGAVALLSDESLSAQFVEAVENHPGFGEWGKLRKERKRLEEEELELSRKYATHRRFLRAFENVALATNLEAEAREGYRRLLEAEKGGFWR